MNTTFENIATLENNQDGYGAKPINNAPLV